MREAGDHTTWTDPDEDYEAAVHAAVDAAFDDDRGPRRSSTSCVARIATAGWSNALAAKLLALTMPGVPDVYQGTEIGRAQPGRPRQPAAGRLRRGRAAQPGRRHPSAPKQSARPAARRCGCVATDPSCSRRTTPSPAEGPAADHVLAFDRGGASPSSPGCRSGWRRRAAGATPCFRRAWRSAWTDVVSRRSLRSLLNHRVGARSCNRPHVALLGDLPVALLVKEA